MHIIYRNLFTKLRIDNFQTQERLEPMSRFKIRKLMAIMKHIADMPAGEIALSNPILNRRLKKIQREEPHAIDTSIETIYLLRIIVSNVNATMNYGMPVRGIIQLGQYLRSRGDKVDFVKLEHWLAKLHITRLAQLQGSVITSLLGFSKDDLHFVKRVERNAVPLTLRSISNIEHDEAQHAGQDNGLPPHNTRKLLCRNISYLTYAPMETIGNLLSNFSKSLPKIEE